MDIKSVKINQLRRWIILDKLFKEKPNGYSMKELRNEINKIIDSTLIRRNTIYTDIIDMNIIFHDKIFIVNDKNKKIWKYENPKKSILDFRIDKNTSAHLKLLLLLIKDDLEEDVFEKTKKIFDAICNYETETLEFEINDSSFNANQKFIYSTYRNNSENIFFEKIYNAISTKQAISILYNKVGQGVDKKLLSPLGFKEYNNSWYFIARDNKGVEDTNPKIYKLTKVLKVDLIDGEYQKQPNFDLYDYFKYSIGTYHEHNKKPILLKIELNGQNEIMRFFDKPFVKDYKIIKEDKNSQIVSMKVFNSYELINELFSYGNKIKIIEPTELIEEYTKKLNEILRKY